MRFFLLGLSLVACAPAVEKTAAPPKSAHAQQRLQKVIEEHTRLEKQFASVPAEDRSRCEFQAGDCLVLVSENRDKLISSESLMSCRGIEDAARESACLKTELEKRGKHEDLASHFTFENMCIQRILGCTSDLEDKAIAAQKQERFEARRRDIETSPQGLSAWHDAEASQEKLRYLRSTLPPPAVEACLEMNEVKSCTQSVKSELKHFEAELRKDAYDAKAASVLYDKLKRHEASCSDPELSCIFQTLQRYGALPETRKWTQQNMDLLEQRQALASKIGPEAVTECIVDPAADHEERILSAYKIYAHEPVLYFRTQLEKAFIAMHQAQVICLTSKRKAGAAESAPTAAK